MNYLQLTQKLRQKVGAPGSFTTLVAATGETLDLASWISEAWDLIQAEHPDWQWMRGDVSFQTVASKNFYLPSAASPEIALTDFGHWKDLDSWRCYRTSLGRTDESWLVPWDYQTWRDTYDFGLQPAVLGKPSVFAVRDKDDAILLGTTPDAVYTVTGQYQKAPTTLAVDADTPAMPARFHWAIVYRAMVLYGRFEGAAEVESDGQTEYDKLYAALELDQLDRLDVGEPLA